MDLFTLKVEKEKLHPNFKSILGYNIPEGYVSIGMNLKKDREVLSSWCDGFPDRDNKFVKEFQTTFNPCFWEIYLYKLFKDFNFNFNWDKPSPDFLLNSNGIEFIVEATTANKANDERLNEWDKEEPLANIFNPDAYEHYLNNMNEANRYSIIRLSNGIFSKFKKYNDNYSNLEHVKNKPFVIAIAPFEQPFFHFQYSRPIIALLYDVYVDEEISYKNPDKFPYPPTVYLNFVEKDNGAEIPLGLFNNDEMKEISAIIFNCNALWTKLSNKPRTMNFLTKEGISMFRSQELIEDSLFIFHNPFAKYPLDKSLFRKDRVCQVYLNNETITPKDEDIIIELENGKELIIEINGKHMINRLPF
jgi:hypothetical protein